MERLIPTVRHYAWGDLRFLADLQGREPGGVPEAELWMGTHPSAPSRLARTGEGLDVHIMRDPVGQLGPAARHGTLPFLAKVLAAARPLSIQTHPTPEQARAGFDRENERGLLPDDPRRVYKDPNHKPELICALTRFEAKCGFRELDDARSLFDALGGQGLRPVCERLGQAGAAADVYTDLLTWLFALEPAVQSALVDAAVDACETLTNGVHGRVARWTRDLAALYPGDVSVVIALLLNHVVLEPGQALFLGAGNLHSYLRGAGVELMANSDNVVRCGLTAKPVDPDELLRIVDCTPSSAQVQVPSGPVHEYTSAVPEFALVRLEVSGELDFDSPGPEILVLTEGEITVNAPGHERLRVRPGWPVWIAASDERYSIGGEGVLHRCTVGVL